MSRVHAGPLDDALAAMRERLPALVERIHDRDHTVWQEDPTEVADRLGWLDAPWTFLDRAGELADLATEVRDDGIDHVLLLGMGGSSLYPEVLARIVGVHDPGCRLTVLDSTHPAAVARAVDTFDPARTLVVASSKSGGTIETRSLLEVFWAELVDHHGVQAAGRHVVAVTDPGSSLADLGAQRGFRAVVENPPDIGGRFSALSAFGLVPAALLGIPLADHLASGTAMLDQVRHAPAAGGAADLGAVMATADADGRHALTLLLPDEVAAFGDWVEQLVAESTGKHGRGLLPVLGETAADVLASPDHRLVVAHGEPERLDEMLAAGVPVVVLDPVGPDELAGEVVRWEFATAVCGGLQRLNPFDQPNVQAAKAAASRLLDAGEPLPTSVPVDDLLAQVTAGDTVVLLGFVDPGGPLVGTLHRAADAIRHRHQVPVTVGVGPRYLHSTGQLHKGGADTLVCVLTVEEPTDDVDVPDRDHTFGQLLLAQAAGDAEALAEAGRRVGRVSVDDLRVLAAASVDGTRG